MRSNRRVRLIGFLGIMVAVVVGSHGWASAHPGSHTGLTWICKATQTVACDYNLSRNLNPTHSLSFYNQGSGHTNNGSYNMKFVAGAHTSLTDFACENGTIFNGGQNIVASSTGSWSGRGPLLMPAATGAITVCTTGLPGNDSRNFIASQFLLWTVM